MESLIFSIKFFVKVVGAILVGSTGINQDSNLNNQEPKTKIAVVEPVIDNSKDSIKGKTFEMDSTVIVEEKINPDIKIIKDQE